MSTHAPTTPATSSPQSKKQQLIQTYVAKLRAASTLEEVLAVVNGHLLYGEHLRRFTIQEESIISRAIRDAKARVEKQAAKKPSKSERVDRALRAALSMHDYSDEYWQKRIAEGASDNDIYAALVDQFRNGIGSQTEDGIQFAARGLSPDGNHVPCLWLDSPTHMTTQKPTLKGAALVKRVREVLSIPQVRSFHDKDSPPVEEAAPPAEAKPGDMAHEFKPTTARNGRCMVCNQVSDTEPHRAWKAAQRERESNGQPKQTPEGWREKAAAMFANVTRYRENPQAGKSLTAARERDWEGKLRSATMHRRWGLTLEAIAAAIEAGTLPPVLNGLTNQYQVRQLMDCVVEGTTHRPYGVPDSMGPTIRSAEEFAEAVRALSPLVPIVEPYTIEGEQHGYGSYGSEATTEPAMSLAPAATEPAVDVTLAALGDDAIPVVDAPVDAPVAEPFIAEIEVQLNDHDVAQKARQAAVLATEIAELEAEKKESDAAYKKKIGGKEEERDKLLSEIGRGRATLELKVIEHRDWEQKMVEQRRVDTGEVVRSRPMNLREYQQPLPIA